MSVRQTDSISARQIGHSSSTTAAPVVDEEEFSPFSGEEREGRETSVPEERNSKKEVLEGKERENEGFSSLSSRQTPIFSLFLFSFFSRSIKIQKKKFKKFKNAPAKIKGAVIR